ncbi:MAG: hypothetical protein JNL05_15765 [Flavobacteriales bacterium]|nr:hypothetical protein [Flavobacteriales bacterium]
MRKRLAASIVVIGAAFFVAYLSGALGKRDRTADRAFDPLAWRQGDRRTRGAMTADLEHSARLIGLTKGEVLDLLGAPTASDTAGHALAYVVDLGLRTGPWGLGGPWPFQTTVLFDSTSHRVNAVRTRD